MAMRRCLLIAMLKMEENCRDSDNIFIFTTMLMTLMGCRASGSQ